MHALYTFVYTLGLCAFAPRVLLDLLRGGKYAVGLAQRLGMDLEHLEPCRGGIWIHAVSVGEVHAARGLLPYLRELFPDLPVVLSTTTATGQEMARRAGADATFFCPLDLPWVVRRTLDRLRPRALVLVETEVWPNLVRACAVRGIPTALVNARLSERSYRRYRVLGETWGRVIRQLDVICARTGREAERYRALGCRARDLYVTGNLKGDAAALQPPDFLRRMLSRVLHVNGAASLVVAGCTMPGEEEEILTAFAEVRGSHPEVRLLLAPRHPERFDRVAEAVSAAGWRLRRRSTGGPDDAEVLLLDTIGELPAAYGLGTVSFVGGSLVPAGGHNLLEPAVQSQPVLFGPHMDNFTALASSFRDSGAGLCVQDASELASAVEALLANPERRRRMGDLARRVALRDAAVGRRTAEVLAAAVLDR